MDVNTQSMINGLTELVRAIGRDGTMQQWFWGLGQKSVEQRRNAVYAMSAQIASLGKSGAHLALAFKSLAIPQVFNAACTALRECGPFEHRPSRR